MIETSIKKEILNSWSNNFADLSVYSQNKLYKICGAFVLGIEILSLRRTEGYRPIFVCYPLWKFGIKQCLEEPVCIQEIHNKKDLQFNIPYVKHNAFLQEAVECTKKQVPILSNQNVATWQLLEFFDKQFSQTLIKSSPVGHAKLFEGKLLCALYANDVNAIERIWTEIQGTSKSWLPNLFEWKYGGLDAWLQSLQETILNRQEFLKQIEVNKQDKKISNLDSSKLKE